MRRDGEANEKDQVSRPDGRTNSKASVQAGGPNGPGRPRKGDNENRNLRKMGGIDRLLNLILLRLFGNLVHLPFKFACFGKATCPCQVPTFMYPPECLLTCARLMCYTSTSIRVHAYMNISIHFLSSLIDNVNCK